MDFELGYGSHEDPVGVTIKSIKEAKTLLILMEEI